jgi:hypothetical protein
MEQLSIATVAISALDKWDGLLIAIIILGCVFIIAWAAVEYYRDQDLDLPEPGKQPDEALGLGAALSIWPFVIWAIRVPVNPLPEIIVIALVVVAILSATRPKTAAK